MADQVLSQPLSPGLPRPRPNALPPPDGTRPSRVNWVYASSVVFYHAAALLAVLPWFFSWIGIVLAVLGLYVFGTLGINLCYHRLLTHRGFDCPKWLEHGLAVLGVCCLQETPARWVAVHRRHHQHADEPEDPHSPLVSFYWSHVGWVVMDNRELSRLPLMERYAGDILRDRFYVRLERRGVWVWIVLASWATFFFGGVLMAAWRGAPAREAAQLGASLLVWGVFVRTVLVWHITWSVNSVTHRWGYRNYNTDEDSRNNLLIGFLSNGEGWHNNHHADPRSARHGHRWFELDVTWITIRLLHAAGLVTRVTRTSLGPPHQPSRPTNPS